jgi:hypothetical protein
MTRLSEPKRVRVEDLRPGDVVRFSIGEWTVKDVLTAEDQFDRGDERVHDDVYVIVWAADESGEEDEERYGYGERLDVVAEGPPGGLSIHDRIRRARGLS